MGGSNELPPPPPPGRPGFGIVGGGALSKSANYQLTLTVGEGPGGNAVYTSKHYRLITGVVSSTEP
jgi:hypothetical protein